MTYDLEDKKNIIYLKNQLIHGDVKKLKELYSSEDGYAFFLDTFNIALDTEPIFFLLDDSILRKAEDIFYNKRFDFKDPNITQVTNEIIGRLNSIRAVPENIKNLKCRQYSMWQQQIRGTAFTSKDDLLGGLAYDAILMEKLYQGKLGEVDAVYFFASTNYLAQVLPEFYQEDPARIDLTMARLDAHASKLWIWNWAERDFAKKAINNLQKVKAKEE
ncbi:MAG: hypothetical protein IJE53_07360 [Bacilli bacterium]|nr:hypothetical protein [Bacilli bacterium]